MAISPETCERGKEPKGPLQMLHCNKSIDPFCLQQRWRSPPTLGSPLFIPLLRITLRGGFSSCVPWGLCIFICDVCSHPPGSHCFVSPLGRASNEHPFSKCWILSLRYLKPSVIRTIHAIYACMGLGQEGSFG